MNHQSLVENAQSHLEFLCSVEPNRRTGSAGNQAAVNYVASNLGACGLELDTASFEVLDYVDGGSRLTVGDEAFEVHTSPYSPGCQASAELVAAETVEQLERLDCRGKLLLLTGEICAEQLMPKGFVFYNPESHQRIVSLLEAKAPAAMITATGRSPEQAGALDPFPLVVDGDFEIPSVFCRQAEGRRLTAHLGSQANLTIDSRRLPSHAANVIAARGKPSARKVILTAHLDAYEDSPGAFDNASGVVVLMMLAELLTNYRGDYRLELAVLNGEDHYSVAGQMDYLSRYGGQLGQADLAVNIDGVGHVEGAVAYSFYDCSAALAEVVGAAFRESDDLLAGPQWFAGDHMIFLQNGVPCLALTAEKTPELMRTIVHTARDTPEIIDPGKLVEVSLALERLVQRLGESS